MIDSKKSQKPIKVYNSEIKYGFQRESKLITFSKIYKTINTENVFNEPNQTSIDAYCVVGFIEASQNSYLIVASEADYIGEILNAKVFKIIKFSYIPNKLFLPTEEDQKCLKMLDDFLSRNSLYFSDSIDLTIKFQQYTNQIKSNRSSYLFPYTLSNFCWNYFLAKYFDYKEMNKFIFPIINGFFGAEKEREDNLIKYILIARKDNRRSGMRFLIRGADTNGNVANFVETEEIVIYKDLLNTVNILSFVQIRGSIPLLWTQEPNFQLNPPIIPKDDFKENTQIFNMHINDIMNTYGNIVILNLIDKKRDQKIIGEYYQLLSQNFKEQCKDNKSLDFVWFDFHHECKKMKYQNLGKLIKSNSVTKGINNFGYTHITLDYSKLMIAEINLDILLHSKETINFIKQQNGTFRTNCIDSLDRTNVVQSVFARHFLHKILYDLALGENLNGDPFQKFKAQFEEKFKKIWADHGDALALAYSGTKAMKSDFVRTGKRTLKGNLEDGVITSTRFYINNFQDGYNQDCHDYFLGIIQTKKDNFKQHTMNSVKIILSICFILTYIFYHSLISFALPKKYEDNWSKRIYRVIIFLGCLILTLKIILGNFKKSLIDTHTKHYS